MSKLSNNAYLKDENILSLLSLNNLIVPEIQREYVWGNNPEVLRKFLNDIKKEASICTHCGYSHGDKNINVGFLYSYKPPYVELESGRYLDEFLIDGQQRITTIFLLMLTRAVKEDCLEEFLAITRTDELGHPACFCYKVRTLTQSFIDRLILHVKESSSKTSLDFVISKDYPTWLLSDYLGDPTVEAMLEAIKIILETFDDEGYKYFDYILRSIHFWHFKTEATSQGEDLYITMNSRGEQLTRNEMQKAELLPSEDIQTWGPIWEEWQTFFWKKRNGNVNADKGFNSYLACTEGLESFLLGAGSVDIKKLKLYIDALEYISSKQFKSVLSETYPNCNDWFDEFLSEVWDTINGTSDRSKNIDWKITRPIKGDQESKRLFNNQAPIKNKAMIMWPWMYYYVTATDKDCIDDNLLIRILHFYYIRYNCYKRSVTTIKRIIDAVLASGNNLFDIHSINEYDEDVDDTKNNAIFSEEELYLSKLFAESGEKQTELESCVWNTQHCPEILDGRDVGSDTIYPFIENKFIVETKESECFEQIKVDVNDILHHSSEPSVKDSERYDLLRRILIYYNRETTFWKQQSPWYYTNYEMNSWKRIVRTDSFMRFLKEFREFQHDGTTSTRLAAFHVQKQNSFLKQDKFRSISYLNPLSHSDTIAIYDIVSSLIWPNNTYNLVLWQENKVGVKIFDNQPSLWGGNRYYDSNSQILLREDWRNVLLKRCASIGLSIDYKDYDIVNEKTEGLNEIPDSSKQDIS